MRTYSQAVKGRNLALAGAGNSQNHLQQARALGAEALKACELICAGSVTGCLYVRSKKRDTGV